MGAPSLARYDARWRTAWLWLFDPLGDLISEQLESSGRSLRRAC
jgi:hypothetical protein